ncbi:calcium-independent phospholipase A2-gamma [Aspergillus awamori]|uniref:Calcium-independent phospholipase A2-gamma n=1 Tax=Aspergillus awamori TaxID=105351 RepID=A0A401KMG1_ASPAW|nr:calcium-independent phospholipase A2-gamma [Aspergillus awamori]
MSSLRITEAEATKDVKNFEGLHIVPTPEYEQAGTGPSADIIFIHDPHGHPYYSWVNNDTGEYWPSLLYKELGNVKLWSYGYITSLLDPFTAASKNFIRLWMKKHLSECEILLSCRRADVKLRDLVWRSCVGVVFMDASSLSYNFDRAKMFFTDDTQLWGKVDDINKQFESISHLLNIADIANTPRSIVGTNFEISENDQGPLERDAYRVFSISNSWQSSAGSNLVLEFLRYKLPQWLQIWHGRALPPKPQGQISEQKKNDIRLLSIDGGGVRGLCSLLLLQRLMDSIRKLETKRRPGTRHDRRIPADYFDLAGGTSTGGLICIMLFRLRMDVQSAIKAYKDLAPVIFRQSFTRFLGFNVIKAFIGRPWFHGEALEKAVKNLVHEYLPDAERDNLNYGDLPSEVSLYIGDGNNDAKMFVCAVREDTGVQEMFRTYPPGSHCKVWQAARATSAAPFYFPTAWVDGVGYWDGGLRANNPVRAVWEEKRRVFPDRGTKCVMSVGTGHPIQVTGSWVPFIGNATRILHHVMNPEVSHLDFEETANRHNIEYERFDPSLENDDIGLADYGKLDILEKHTTNYLNAEVTRSKIEHFANLLARWQDQDQQDDAEVDSP